MTEFCPLPLDTVTKRRFWESLDNRSRSLLSSRPDVLERIFDSVRVRERYRADTWERQWKRREWRRVCARMKPMTCLSTSLCLS